MLRVFGGSLALCVACGSTAKPPALVADGSSVDFATTFPGETSAEANVRVSNAGGRPTAALATALAGDDAADFAITSDGCAGAALAPAASCEVHVVFHPSEERQFGAQLRITGGDASATVAMSGRGETGARLSISRPAQSFGGVSLGASVAAFVTLTNTGLRASSPISFDASGDTGSFTVLGNCLGRALAPSGSCDLQVTFSPQNVGPKALLLALSGSGHAPVRATFDGYGKRLVTLAVTAEGEGNVAVSGSMDTCTALPCRLRFEIGGPAQRASLVAQPGAKSLFGGWSGDCSGALLSCDLPMDGDRSVLAKFAAGATITLEGTALAGGSGVIGIEGGASCTAPCHATAVVQRGSRIRLTATAGTSSQFRWRDGCAGTAPSCDVTVVTDTNASAVFNGANYVFVASTAYWPNLGVAAYDDACNRSAHAAGLPGTYVAWLSTSKQAAVDRIGSARGFIRVDGRPFADTLAPGAPIYYPVALDEFGGARGSSYPEWAMTGSDELGQLTAGYNCSDWTVDGGSGLRLGDPMGGAGVWSGSAWSGCGSSWLLYCIGTAIQRPLQRDKAVGRLAFVSSDSFAPGGGLAAADFICSSEARAGGLSGSFKALLAVNNASPASRFDLRGAPWVRLDGVAIVDTAADLGTGNLLAPVEMSASGAYDFSGKWAWLGAVTPGVPGTADSTCASWTSNSPAGYGRFGAPTSISPGMGLGTFSTTCDWTYRLYCLQE